MNQYADYPAGRRVRWLARFAVVWAALIVGRLVFLQVVSRDEFKQYARDQQTHLKVIPASRGTIYDRQGRPLAMSVPVETVSVNPMLLPNRALAARLVAPVLNIDEKDLLSRLDSYAAARKGYMVVARRVDAERAGRLRTLGVDWFTYEAEGVRRYPNGELASHLLGGVDHEEHGNGGLELQFDEELGGAPGYEIQTTDVKRRSFDSSMESLTQAGRNVVTTIDRRIQFAADQALKKAVIENRCSSGTVVVMNPYNGEVLAVANYPTYDPNEAPKGRNDYTARKNRAVGDPFEPGSVFKVFTIAGALETTGITPETPFHCSNGAYAFAGRVLHEAHGGYGVLSVAEILAKSSNIGAVKIGQRMGEKKLYEYLMRFGFNQPTGIELPSESKGLVFRLNRWQPGSIGSVPMGHEVLVTSMQLARGVSVIANGGFLVRPHLTIAKPFEGPQIQLVSYRPIEDQPQRILKPETAITMRRMMEGVVLFGTGKNIIRLDGYSAGGKTGTAQMFDHSTGRYSHRYNASFMGFAPVTNPAVVVVATLNDSSKYGGVVAGPVFNEVMQTALRILNVPRDIVEPQPLPQTVEAQPEGMAIADTSSVDATRLHEELADEQQASGEVSIGPSVPNFIGKTIRDVIEESAAQGVRVDLSGSGLARRQEPPAGTRLAVGQRVKVVFER
jgi:cell division protein FtsI (penicillin-binding protein 3)